MESCISYEKKKPTKKTLDKWLGVEHIFYQNNVLSHKKYITGGCLNPT